MKLQIRHSDPRNLALSSSPCHPSPSYFRGSNGAGRSLRANNHSSVLPTLCANSYATAAPAVHLDDGVAAGEEHRPSLAAKRKGTLKLQDALYVRGDLKAGYPLAERFYCFLCSSSSFFFSSGVFGFAGGCCGGGAGFAAGGGAGFFSSGGGVRCGGRSVGGGVTGRAAGSLGFGWAAGGRFVSGWG